MSWLTLLCAGLVIGMLIAIGLLYAAMVRLSKAPACEICGGRIENNVCEFCGQEWRGG